MLCVHRMPFDNSQYPDRRFKRSQPEFDVPEKNSNNSSGGVIASKPMTGEYGSQGGNIVSFSEKAMSYKHE